MDRDERAAAGSHIRARNAIAGVEVSVYLSPEDWQELATAGSVEITQPWDDAPSDARVIRVTLYQR